MEASEGKLSFFARDDFRHFASKPSPGAGDYDRFVFEIHYLTNACGLRVLFAVPRNQIDFEVMAGEN
jgi:hypothetical protein